MQQFTTKLKGFNEEWDKFILEFIKPVGMLSLGLGTVAIFNLNGLAIWPPFVILWAIVQAASIDGLFFATWDRLFGIRLKWRNTLAILGLLVIGLILAMIAIAINAILSFQVLWDIADSETAMARLGISPVLFTAIRAGVAVIVFIMISFVRARSRANESIAIEPIAKPQVARKRATVIVQESEPLAIPEVAESQSSSKYELIKEAMARANASGLKKIKLTAIAEETGAGYSTVKLYAPKIKQELNIE